MRNPFRQNPLTTALQKRHQNREAEWQRGMMYVNAIKQLRENPETAAKLLDLGKKQEPPVAAASQEEMLHASAVSIWVYAAINVTAEKSATIPWHIVNTDQEVMDDHPFTTETPNPLQSWNMVRQLIQMHLDLTGCGYLLVDDSNTVTYYWVLQPNQVRVVVGMDKERPSIANHAPIIVGYAFKSGGFEGEMTFSEKSLNKLWSAGVLTTPELNSLAIDNKVC